MKKTLLLILLSFLFLINLNGEEKEDNKYFHNFSGAYSQSINLIVFKDISYSFDFYEFSLKYDYLFSRKISHFYRLGFCLSFADSINLGGLFPAFYGFYYYQFFNEISQKFTFVNIIGNVDKNNYALLEIGGTISLVNFISLYNYYYLTCFIAPYLFIGFYKISPKSSVSHIVGGFVECNFDIGKYTSDVYTVLRGINCYVGFGLEYRFGYTLKK